MNNATQHHIGLDQSARAETTTAASPTIGRVCPIDEKTKGRRRGTKRQTEICTGSTATNGILGCTFLPKLKTAESIQACEKTATMERDFYKSLFGLASHYDIEPMPTKEYGFPYNITLARWDIETMLKCSVTNWDSLPLVQNSKKTYLVSKERYDTGANLYYIPIVPLFRMIHDKERKHNAQLLISVCCYLYHIANIPYYRQKESYVCWQYELYEEWIEQDDETDETECYKSELREAECIGDRIEQKLSNRINLTLFEQHLSRFKSRDTFDRECQQIARNAFVLYTEYPTTTIFRNVPIPEANDDTDYCHEIIGMEKYISFVADTKGWLYESLSENINNEFNEYEALEEPTIYKHFDGSKITATNLDFENRLFTLLDDLCSLLFDYKTTEK